MYERIENLDAATLHGISASINNLLNEKRDTLIPVCTQNHFYLLKLKINKQENDISPCSMELYDSLQTPSNLKIKNFQQLLLQQTQKLMDLTGIMWFLPPEQSWVLKNKKCAQQKDSFNCGVYLLNNAEIIMKGMWKWQYFFINSLNKTKFQADHHLQKISTQIQNERRFSN